MSQRINYYEVGSEAIKIMFDMEKYLGKSSISVITKELIKIRASQINQCAFCLDMHTKDARKYGETEQRIYCLPAWRECDFYSDEERAAFELTEYMTNLPTHGVPDELYDRVRTYYNEQQYTEIVFMIAQINCWNRISIAMGNKPAAK